MATNDPIVRTSEEKHDEYGREIMDDTPIKIAVRRPESMFETMRRNVQLAKLELLRDNAIEETEEEADDFEVGDDFVPLSRYENDHIPSIKEAKLQIAAWKREIERQNLEAALAASKKASLEKSIPEQDASPEPAPPQSGGSART